MFKIKELDRMVFVNEKKRTCVVKINYEVYIKRCPCGDEFGNYTYVTCVGKAKCAAEDEFDETIGVRIADNKAMLKVLNFAEKKIMEYATDVEAYAKELIEDCDKVINMRDAEYQSIIRNGGNLTEK